MIEPPPSNWASCAGPPVSHSKPSRSGPSAQSQRSRYSSADMSHEAPQLLSACSPCLLRRSASEVQLPSVPYPRTPLTRDRRRPTRGFRSPRQLGRAHRRAGRASARQAARPPMALHTRGGGAPWDARRYAAPVRGGWEDSVRARRSRLCAALPARGPGHLAGVGWHTSSKGGRRGVHTASKRPAGRMSAGDMTSPLAPRAGDHKGTWSPLELVRHGTAMEKEKKTAFEGGRNRAPYREQSDVGWSHPEHRKADVERWHLFAEMPLQQSALPFSPSLTCRCTFEAAQQFLSLGVDSLAWCSVRQLRKDMERRRSRAEGRRHRRRRATHRERRFRGLAFAGHSRTQPTDQASATARRGKGRQLGSGCGCATFDYHRGGNECVGGRQGRGDLAHDRAARRLPARAPGQGERFFAGTVTPGRDVRTRHISRPQIHGLGEIARRRLRDRRTSDSASRHAHSGTAHDERSRDERSRRESPHRPNHFTLMGYAVFPRTAPTATTCPRPMVVECGHIQTSAPARLQPPGAWPRRY